jgi:putative SOS response-associated peptidase YedK
MCNLYRLDAPANQIAAHFDADPGTDPWEGGYVAPQRPGPVIISDGRPGSRRRIVPRLWGFPPPPKGRAPVTNVRNLESPFWIGTLRHPELRCLVPVTRFQEWSGEKGSKRAHWFTVPSQPIFAFAGIWRQTDDWATFAFLTCEPNRLVGAVHPKAMPVILHAEDYERWLTADWKDAAALVAPFPSQLMTMEDDGQKSLL